MPVTVVYSGLGLGVLYGFIGIGFAIGFAALGRFNFAFPQFLVAGVFLSYWAGVTLQLPLVWTLAIAGVGCGLLALIEYVFVLVPVARRGAHGGELVATVGFAIVIQGAIEFIWGNTPLGIPSPVPTGAIDLLGGRVVPGTLILLGIVVAIAAGLEVLSRFTGIGLAIRAVRQDREAAAVLGISPARIGIAVLVITAVFAGFLGPLVGSRTAAVSDLGNYLAVGGFIAYASAGEEAYLGTLLLGLLIGVAQSEVATLLNVNFQNLALLVLLSVALIAKPTGLFGRGGLRAV